MIEKTMIRHHYATNSELGFDYLRDNMKYSEKKKFKEDIFFQSLMKLTLFD